MYYMNFYGISIEDKIKSIINGSVGYDSLSITWVKEVGGRESYFQIDLRGSFHERKSVRSHSIGMGIELLIEDIVK